MLVAYANRYVVAVVQALRCQRRMARKRRLERAVVAIAADVRLDGRMNGLILENRRAVTGKR